MERTKYYGTSHQHSIFRCQELQNQVLCVYSIPSLKVVVSLLYRAGLILQKMTRPPPPSQNSHCTVLVKISCTSTMTSESLWGEGTVHPLYRRHHWLLCQEMMGGCRPCLLRETCNGLTISHRLWMPHNLWLDLEEKFLALFFTALATSFPYYDSVLFAKGRLVICCLIILSCLDMINFFFLSLISPSITFFVMLFIIL